MKGTVVKVAAVVAIGVLAFPILSSAQEAPEGPDEAANTYGSVEPIANPDVLDTGPLRDQSLAVETAFADRRLECGIVDLVIDALTATGAVTTIDGLNTSFAVGAGGFAGHTSPAFVYTVIDSGPNAASVEDVQVLTNSLGYVLSQGSAFLLDGDDPTSYDFPANYVVLVFDTAPPLAVSQALFETVGAIDPELFETFTSGYTQYGRAYLSLQSDVPDARFIDGYVQAAEEFGVEYTPVIDGTPGLFQGGAAFPDNDWATSPDGGSYLDRIPDAAEDALAEIRDGQLKATRDALRFIEKSTKHGQPSDRALERGLSKLPCRT